MSPPRSATALLRLLAAPSEAEILVGDLEEAHRARVARRGARIASVLTWLEALDIAFMLVRRRLRIDRSPLSRRARPKWWIVVPLVWAVPGTVAALQSLTSAMYSTRGIGSRDWIFAAAQFPRYMLWAALTPLIFAAVRRFPFQTPRLARSIAIHFCIALLCIALVEALSTQIQSQLMSVAMNRTAK